MFSLFEEKKIKFKKCARAILDSDNKMPSCSPVVNLVPRYAGPGYEIESQKFWTGEWDQQKLLASCNYYNLNDKINVSTAILGLSKIEMKEDTQKSLVKNSRKFITHTVESQKESAPSKVSAFHQNIFLQL